VILEHVGPTTKCSPRLVGEEDSKGNLTKAKKYPRFHYTIKLENYIA